jgi:hypothetical protein
MTRQPGGVFRVAFSVLPVQLGLSGPPPFADRYHGQTRMLEWG